jgi:CxxC motif-containing protein
MNKQLICIECPVGCILSVDIENCRVVKVSGNKCPKGEAYAAAEAENPVRILTSTVFCENLDLKFLPVRTDKPVPKAKLLDLMREIKDIRLRIPVRTGDIVKANILGLGVNLIASRSTKPL